MAKRCMNEKCREMRFFSNGSVLGVKDCSRCHGTGEFEEAAPPKSFLVDAMARAPKSPGMVFVPVGGESLADLGRILQRGLGGHMPRAQSLLDPDYLFHGWLPPL